MKKQNHGTDDERMLQLHRMHLGLYKRVARRLSVDPSYVSRVAQGKRTNERIKTQLLNELRKIEQEKRRNG